MKFSTGIIFLSYFCSAISVIEGIIAAKRLNLHPFVQFLSGIIAAFLGSILSNLLLHTATPINPMEVAFTTVIGIVTTRKKSSSQSSFEIPLVLNTFVICSLTIIGYAHGIYLDKPWWICITVSLLSTFGGCFASYVFRIIVSKIVKVYSKHLLKGKLNINKQK